MAGRPVFVGAVQLTSRLVVLPEVAVTEGSAGASGGSFTFVTFSVTSMVALAVPSDALTVSA